MKLFEFSWLRNSSLVWRLRPKPKGPTLLSTTPQDPGLRCDGCGVQSSSAAKLARHKRLCGAGEKTSGDETAAGKHKENFKCVTCKKSFNQVNVNVFVLTSTTITSISLLRLPSCWSTSTATPPSWSAAVCATSASRGSRTSGSTTEIPTSVSSRRTRRLSSSRSYKTFVGTRWNRNIDI